jgi:peptide/nickel transport system permease protein
MNLTTPVSALDTADAQDATLRRSRGHWANVAARLVRNPGAMIAAGILLLLIFAAIAAPWVMPGDPFATSMFARLKPIGTAGHLLGTDELGRDLFSRLLLGGRLSLFMGITPVLLAFVIIVLVFERLSRGRSGLHGPTRNRQPNRCIDYSASKFLWCCWL